MSGDAQSEGESFKGRAVWVGDDGCRASEVEDGALETKVDKVHPEKRWIKGLEIVKLEVE